MASEPYPKTKQLARGEKRYRRKVASPKQWAAIRAEKLDGQACRICGWLTNPELHHIVPRDRGGDDVAANLLPLCRNCHTHLEARHPVALGAVARSLTDAEYAYVVGKLGENALERLFGV